MSEGRIIIVEGTDAVGKTTLVRELAARAGSRTAMFHAGPPAKDATLVSEYIIPLVIARDGWTCICDRWHLGEPVWSNVFGRTPIVTFEQLHVVEKRLKSLEVPISTMYLKRDPDEIIAELDRRAGEMTRVGASLEAIELYEKARKYSMFYWDETTLPDALVHFEES
jgi:thymidylate kinase